ncbi:MAG: glycogen/starch/alpha-glucan phosphorylase [Gemmataceae bacterium]|nr:glycogen/starch/alpha-glucan phosphorylase [Gemmataceae bacterium]
MSSPTTPLQDNVLYHVTYSLGETRDGLDAREAFRALALAVRDRLIAGMLQSESRYRQANAKRLCYLSMEYLIGRSLTNNLVNLGLLDEARSVLNRLGFDWNQIEEQETDAALGNGGLGRLAACYLDSMATQNSPAMGYGINYEFGLFRQEIRNGEQVEKPDCWRGYESPWLIERPQDAVLVPMYGRIEHALDRKGQYNPMWLDWRVVVGVPHDLPIVGYGGQTVNVLRLYSARASQEMDMSIFNLGDYLAAVEQKVRSETISKVLYPSEAVAAGRELRLQQEYFLVACAIRDVVRRFQRDHEDFAQFPNHVAIQLNDTHPALAVAELMRILVDEQDLSWDRAWEITEATFGYTNHTLLPEALERWPVWLLERVLPRHTQIIFEINRRFLEQVQQRWPGDVDRLRRMSLIEEGSEKQVRMAHLAIVGSQKVNGVAAVHSRLVRTQLVPDFAELWPQKFLNVTNGVTPRRWLLAANPALAQLLTVRLGAAWLTDLSRLKGLESAVSDPDFRQSFQAVKRANKERLAALIFDRLGRHVDPASLFDVQVKRIHEYKRQLLNLLHIIHDYLRIVDDRVLRGPPRTYIFAGKAAPGYVAAKQIIRLIHDVAQVVNADLRVRDHLRVVFLPDYSVTLAERIIPAADLSEQISTAGTEASGTGNMKFAMNGAMTIGTLDGANIEIREEVGPENIFIFGLTVEQVQSLRGHYRPEDYCRQSESVRRVVQALREGRFAGGMPSRHDWVVQKLLAPGEKYLHLADLDSYLAAHDAAGDLFLDSESWTTKAILNVARIGKFSSDRSVREYAELIWRMKPVPPRA